MTSLAGLTPAAPADSHRARHEALHAIQLAWAAQQRPEKRLPAGYSVTGRILANMKPTFIKSAYYSLTFLSDATNKNGFLLGKPRGYWRRVPESNRPTRICNPVHNRFANAPRWNR
jgi:hypothetical protein